MDLGLRAVLPEPLVRRLEPWGDRLRPSFAYSRPETRQRSDRFFASFPAGARLLDIGAGTRRYARPVTTVDASPLPGIDVVASAESLPLEDGSFDGVLLKAVVHQIRDLDAALAETRRVLAPSGRVMVEAPFLQGYNAGPQGDYWRFTPDGLRALLELSGLQVLRGGVIGGPASAVAWSLAEMLAMLASGDNATRYRYARAVTRWLVQPIKYLDYFLENHRMARAASSGGWVEGRKAPIGLDAG
jgi:SAM-dependent methyltransferase